MINIDEINKTILDLENHDTTYATCEKLSWLYTVRDHIAPSMSAEMVVSNMTPNMEGSDFLIACSGVDAESLLSILDEHMEAIKLVYPKEYDSLMRKIREL